MFFSQTNHSKKIVIKKVQTHVRTLKDVGLKAYVRGQQDKLSASRKDSDQTRH